MANNKQKETAKIIRDGALQIIAIRHGLTVEQVADAIRAGNPKACEQFGQLVAAGVAVAVDLHNNGHISLS